VSGSDNLGVIVKLSQGKFMWEKNKNKNMQFQAHMRIFSSGIGFF